MTNPISFNANNVWLQHYIHMHPIDFINNKFLCQSRILMELFQITADLTLTD